MKSSLIVSLSIIFLAVSGCKGGSDSNKASEMPDPISYLALGDSYTIGEGVEAYARWPEILRDTLEQLGVSMLPPQIIARTGWTTGDLLDAMAEAELKPPYGLVSLLIGVNNQYRGETRGYSLDGYGVEFSTLLGKAIELADGDPDRVLVLSIPDYSVTPFVRDQNKEKVAREIDAYNQLKKQLSLDAGVLFVDITPISQMAISDQSLLVSDNLHPSEIMYRKWVEATLPLLLTSHSSLVNQGFSK